jgi:SPP1 gp7 family putative phage head morphogenesis protein
MRFNFGKLFGWAKPDIPAGLTPKSDGDAIKKYRELDRLRYYAPTSELENLRFARASAESITNPNFAPLVGLFNDIVTNDAHLTNLMRKFRLAVTNKAFAVLGPDGEIDEDATSLLEGQWFRTYLTLVIDAISYGYSLVGFDFTDGIACFEFPREYVIPTHRAIRYATSEVEMVPLETMLGLDFILVQDQTPTSKLGLLNTAAPLAIYKRHSLASWDRFEMMFGMPMRIAKTDDRSPSELAMIESWLEDMGQAAYGIFPSDTEIELLANSGTDAFNVFLQKSTFVNSELSKLYLSQTMTTDDGSSRSQAEVHEAGEAQVFKDNAAFAVDLVEADLFSLLRNNGYDIPEGSTFKFLDEDMSAAERIELIDSKLMAGGVKLTKEYLERTYGVEVAEELLPTVTMHLKKKDLTAAAVKSAVNGYYYIDSKVVAADLMTDAPDNADIIAQIIAAIEAGVEVPESLVAALADSYLDSFTEALGLAGVSDEVVETLTDNLADFSDAKALTEVATLESLFAASPATFAEDAEKMHHTFNKVWQASEFDTTFNGGVNADKWADIQRTARLFPKLRYTTINDDLVRKDHEEMDDMVYPITDPIWLTHYPPNGYNCRCTVRKARESATTTSNFTPPVLPPLFQNNVGITGKVFKDDHPYFNLTP